MELILEIILQIFGEILVQVFFEFLVELGLHSLADTVKAPKNPVLSTIGFIIWGAMAGVISLLIFPVSHIINPDFRKLNLVITPAIVGTLMMVVGKMRTRRGSILVRLDRFGYGFVFALAMALVRYFGAR